MFRGQFIYTRSNVERPPQFVTRKLGDHFLHYDPHLPVEINESGALIGQALDWRNPQKTNADILEDLSSGDLGRTNRLSGRWALILLNGVVIGDGGGTLSIVWNERHVGSSAALLAYCDPELVRKQRPELDAFRLTGWHSGLAFLATDTEVEGVKALLPNHQLHLTDRTVSRFYPTKPLAKASLSQNAPRIAEVVKGLVEAASNRAPLAIGLTSGYDSRLIAAAASAVAPDRTKFFTIQDEHATTSGHADIIGAQQIAQAVGIPHEVHVAPAAARLQEDARASEGMVAARFESWADASTNFPDRTCISGWGSEVGRNYIDWPGSEDAQVVDVLNCNNLTRFPELTQDAQEWLDEARTVQRTHGFKITDLIYWELRVGRWCSAGFNILSQGNWWMTLYTCRDLFEMMLEIPARQRGNRGAHLYPAVIGLLSERITALPYTPTNFSERLGQLRRRDLPHAVGKALHSVGLLTPARKIKRALAG